MIRSVRFVAQFESSPLEFDSHYEFGPGITVITGPNESGKSFILEMIRYGLFGTSALRSPLKEYKKLEVTLEFEVKGKVYEVKREKSGATLREGENVVATGTAPTNSSIIRVLGFSLNVLDTVLASLQDDSQKLTEMTPTERKQMVDSLTGLDGVQKIVSECKARALASKNEVKGLLEAYRPPVQPVKPGGYQESSVILDIIRDFETTTRDIQECEEFLSKSPPEPGPEPDLPPRSSNELKELLYSQNKEQDRINELRRELAEHPEPEYTEQQLLEQEMLHYYWDLSHKYQAPPYSMDQINFFREQNDRLDLVIKKENLIKRLDQLAARDIVNCPSCSHGFYVDQDTDREIDECTFELESIPDLNMEEDFSHLPPREVLDTYEQMWRNRAEHIPDGAGTRQPDISLNFIACERRRLQYDRTLATEELNKLESLIDPGLAAELVQAMKQEKKCADWAFASEEYQGWKSDCPEVVNELTALRIKLPEGETWDSLHARYEGSLEYEVLQKKFEEEESESRDLLQRIEQEKRKGNDWATAAQLATQFSADVKSYLLPSLSRVAGSIVSRITRGGRKSVKVNDEFEIFVDGQPVSTLSGSSKVAVNLALRVGLGQVLTSSTFPVFLADEVDASMDDKRAGDTIQCIRNLSQSMRQIILVSHKFIPDVDCNLRIGQ